MWPWSRYEVMTVSPCSAAGLHAHHHGLLADVEVAEAADQAHAVELARFLFEAADQQHVAVVFEDILGRGFAAGLGSAALRGFRHGGPLTGWSGELGTIGRVEPLLADYG
jgi:hypothetical protein